MELFHHTRARSERVSLTNRQHVRTRRRSDLARSQAVLGDPPGAVASLRMMVGAGLSLDCAQVAKDHAFDTVRTNPIFTELLAEAACV